MRVSDRPRARGTRQIKGKHPEASNHRREAVAEEAARIIQTEGLLDFHGAKTKAAERLGLLHNCPLPSNEEIEAALAARNRIFRGASQPTLVAGRRQAAFQVMRDLAQFHPRLVGDVVSGNTTVHSSVAMHLFTDTVEVVGYALEAVGIGHRLAARRHRLRQDLVEQFPTYQFSAHDCEFVSTVFPLRLRGHPPLSPVDGRPMQRVSLRELGQLLDGGI